MSREDAGAEQPAPRGPREGSAFGWMLLVYMLVVIALVTLAPFRFRWPQTVEIADYLALEDTLLNLFLLAIPGFLFQLARGRGDRLCAWALVAGLSFSAAIEATQLLLPGRYTSPYDVLANGLGAWAGALLYQRIGPTVAQRLAGQLLLELPLVNIVYLTVPLLWLDGLAAGNDPTRLHLALPLGIFGASVTAAVWKNRSGTAWLSANQLALAVMCWFLLACLPALLRAPLVIGGSAALLALITRLLTLSSWLHPKDERRFEVRTLRAVWPAYGLYVVCVALWPFGGLRGRGWLASFSLDALQDEPSVPTTLGLLEYVSAFSLIGYMVAEARGRRREPQRVTLAWVAGLALICATCLEALRGFHPSYRASLLMELLLVGAALWGGLIYRSQLAALKRVLEGRPKALRGSSSPAS